jgi:hypothetical protein
MHPGVLIDAGHCWVRVAGQEFAGLNCTSGLVESVGRLRKAVTVIGMLGLPLAGVRQVTEKLCCAPKLKTAV